MITVSELVKELEAFAPLDLACGWDNSGLQVGWKNAPVEKVLVALDPFEDAIREAVSLGAQMLVTHHPLLFTPAKQITDDTAVGRAIALLLEHHISLWSGHTNVDIAQGGVNDVLAERLGLRDIRPLPPENLLRVGTVKEQKLEDFLSTVKQRLGCPGLRYVDAGRTCKKIAVGGGACGSELELAVEAGCDTFVTGDVKYNQFRDSLDSGMNLIDAGHFWTENPVCAALAAKLQSAFPELVVQISEKQGDCMKFF